LKKRRAEIADCDVGDAVGVVFAMVVCLFLLFL
jgi:hypothetical protein